MNTKHKFSLSFILALTLHLSILALFAVNFTSEPEIIKQKPVPEIIQASILDDNKIEEEANRLKAEAKDKQLKKQMEQQTLENNRKKEQELLKEAKNKRLDEEQKAKEIEKKNRQLALQEKQKLEKIKKQKAEEAARLAKIKQQKDAEKKRLDQLRKEEEKKQELARQAEEKKQQTLLAKQQAEAAKKAAAANAHRARIELNRLATITSTTAIQQKVNNRWIKPMSSSKGLSCTIRVKLLPSGDVMDATVIRSSGDGVFDRSAENAVRKASPLPVPKDRALFSKKFRSFTFEFKPE